MGCSLCRNYEFMRFQFIKKSINNKINYIYDDVEDYFWENPNRAIYKYRKFLQSDHWAHNDLLSSINNKILCKNKKYFNIIWALIGMSFDAETTRDLIDGIELSSFIWKKISMSIIDECFIWDFIDKIDPRIVITYNTKLSIELAEELRRRCDFFSKS